MIYKRPVSRILFAMDVGSPDAVLRYARELDGVVGGFKFGLEFFWAMAENLLGHRDDATAIAALHLYRSIHTTFGGGMFVDAKLADIPTTVEKASVAISGLNPLMFNVHASAGAEAVAAAVKHRGESLVLGVTVLTSLQESCESIFGDTPDKKVLQFARMLQDVGAQGIVCSPQEARLLRQAGIELLLVCPGIRPAWAPSQDQKRVMTPGEAVKEGVDYLVIGRPIADRWVAPLPDIPTPRKAAEVIALEMIQAQEAA